MTSLTISAVILAPKTYLPHVVAQHTVKWQEFIIKSLNISVRIVKDRRQERLPAPTQL